MPNRRHVLRLAAVAPLAALLPADGGRAMSTLDYFGDQAAKVLAAYYDADLGVTRDTAAAHLRTLEHIATLPRTAAAARAHSHATARYRALRGQTLVDLGELDQARAALNRAHLGALHSGDGDLLAYIRGLQAKAEDFDGQYPRALTLLADGRRHAGPALRVRLAAQSLGPLAAMGRRAEFDGMLDWARGMADDAQLPQTAQPSFDGCDRATVARHTLDGYARFGPGRMRADATAPDMLHTLVAVDDARMTGPACTMRLDLASAYALAEPQHACDLVRETVEIVSLFGAPAPTLAVRARTVLAAAPGEIREVRDTRELVATAWPSAA